MLTTKEVLEKGYISDLGIAVGLSNGKYKLNDAIVKASITDRSIYELVYGGSTADIAEAPVEEPVVETPAEEPVVETPTEEPVDETSTEEPVDEKAADEAPADETPVEGPTTETPAEEPVVTEPKAKSSKKSSKK